jgi:alkylation response protein AidB-like acyl-CoA dehydrogenase
LEETRGHRTADFGAAAGTTYNVCGRTMLMHASPEFLRRHVPKMLAGEELWVQYFSEPGAGSDLAGVTTRAERDGDRWILNGSKVWTSAGHYADFGMCLARTNWDVPKHRGLTWFGVKVDRAGVTVRPIRELNGAAEFSQEFFDDVELTDDDVIGDVDNGWTVAQTMLVYERGGGPIVAPSAASRRGPVDEGPERLAPDLVALARKAKRLDDKYVQQVIAAAHIDEWAVGELRKHMGIRIREAGGADTGLRSYAKLSGAVTRARRSLISMQVGGGAILTWTPGDQEGETTVLGFLNGRLGCIAGGTNEVQRNSIGERVLGLPREPSFDTTKPFREVVRDSRHWSGKVG